ncbi:hypothetical protein [Anaerosalibacter massiliensis]|uniref:hypothetical protein n=1 Tax=Anaerosalibacter massiliensis TaxID=1347392 RepID=UPI00164DF79A|nr:hypothetical protein [Anaerosalibacter massiliensis]
MTTFQKELIEGIQEVSTSTGLTVSECIRQAIELTKREKKQFDEYEGNSIEEKSR